MSKVIKLKNTVESKIESVPFSDVVNTMVKEKKIPVPDIILSNMESNKKLIDSYEVQKKLEKQYLRLKTSLESCREARPTNYDNTREKQSVQYFENCMKKNEQTISQIQRMKEAKMNDFDARIREQQQHYEWNKQRYEQAQENLRIGKKTKEEIKLEKQIHQLVMEFKSTNPDKDIEFYFPGYKSFLNSPIVISEPTPPPPPPPPAQQQEEEEEEEEEQIDFNSLTPWQRFLKVNPGKSTYNAYHSAIDMGITPDIPEPAKPVSKRRAKTTETVSRQSLAKILPNYA